MPADDTKGSNPFDQLAQIIGGGYDRGGLDDGDFDDVPYPTHWPSLSSMDAADDWNHLREWVDGLQGRFGQLDHHVIPRCWWRHNNHVEALAALRDHERSSFGATAPATAPVDWFRALRDVTALLKSWTADLGCGATHTAAPSRLRVIDSGDWDRFVTADVNRRRQAEIDQAAR